MLLAIKAVRRQADHSSSELQSAMSALENAISLLGSVTTDTRADGTGAADVVGGRLKWTCEASREEARMESVAPWRLRSSRIGGKTKLLTLEHCLDLLLNFER